MCRLRPGAQTRPVSGMLWTDKSVRVLGENVLIPKNEIQVSHRLESLPEFTGIGGQALASSTSTEIASETLQHCCYRSVLTKSVRSWSWVHIPFGCPSDQCRPSWGF